MEKPIRTGPPCAACAVPDVVVLSGVFTHEAASSIPATPSVKRDTFIILSLLVIESLYHNPPRTRLSMGKRGRLATVFIFLVISCASNTRSSDPAPSHRRAVSPPPAVAQWNHEWARGAVCYEIFIRSFEDADGDGIGDLKGLTAKLDYLNDGDPRSTTDLGIDAIWLTPVFDSPSYHGYDTVDYEAIERDYGTMTDFHHFVDEAHKRGIRVILDFVMNHTSSQHPWFIESASSPTSRLERHRSRLDTAVGR